MDGFGWKARGDFVAPESSSRKPFFPKFRHLFSVIPIAYRLIFYTVAQWWHGRGIFINIFRQLHHKPIYGVPCGGVGTGAVGRDFRGGFCKFSMLPGIVEQRISSVKADQFIVSIRSSKTGSLLLQKVLNAAKQRRGPLSSWAFGFPQENLHYRGLYPRSWTKYEIPEVGVELICRQVSPVIPNDYKDSSLPLSVFVWEIRNHSKESLTVSIAFTFRNGTGDRKWEKEGICRFERYENATCSGIDLKHSINGVPTTYGLSVEKKTELHFSSTTFNPSGDGSLLWKNLMSSGDLVDEEIYSASETKELGVAVSARQTVAAGASGEARFCLVWNQPLTRFGMKKREYRRRYARFFSDVEQLASHAFRRLGAWEKAIEEWQNQVLEDASLPDWYKSALFNELYYLTDGGSSWFEFDEKWADEEPQMSECTRRHFTEHGRFGYLESWEYFMVNTYDVHFYASFAFLQNWPQLQLSMQLDFSDQVLCEDKRLVENTEEGGTSYAKRYGRLPHDLGHPMDEPYVYNNSYMLHDSGEWRDLNLKFILMAYRDYLHIVEKSEMSPEEKMAILQRFYDPIVSIIETGLREWDSDGDRMIENSGTADQTYDIWRMTGTSAYCGGLWLAAVFCAARVAEILEKEDDRARFEEVLEEAKKAYVKKLWNGKYFDFDEVSESRKSVMADQLCGMWFLAMSLGEHPKDIVGEKKAETSLRTVFEYNVMKFGEGRLGPVNGMKPDGSVDISSVQSEEVWTGVGYALGSYMIMMGMRDEGFRTAEGIYRSCWERFGLHYQTPEAFMKEASYRAIGYMRPLSVWAMQRAIEFEKERTQ
ncbi:hypothetical protein QR680_005848 [Steinernema hermaphroditum]|uniref:Non-lysosomal glucosylceramidase n=1 Tax=Steinernema hermaphroditum TaxID=289476 RepID=A0AA39HTH6_9BILA|nr:hypothetical protein QR680_005848 [Steinernema hermaphroditum]